MKSLAAALAILTIGLLVACGSSEQPEPSPELHLLTWEEYVDPAILDQFEAEYGISVVVHTFQDEPELVSRLTSSPGAFDLFISSGSLVGELAESRLIASLDHDNLPNLENIAPAHRDKPWDPGNQYSVPYDWGTTGILYDSRYLSPDDLSWNLFSDPTIATHAALDSDFSVVIGMALISLGHPLNSTDPDHLDDAVSVLQDQVRAGISFEDSYTLRERMIAGELWAAQAFSGDAIVAIDENPNLAYFIPREGADIYFDVLSVPRDAPNKLGAELFLNYLMQPEVHAQATAYTGYENPNAAALRMGLIEGSSDVRRDLYQSVDRLQPWQVFNDAAYSAWNRAWSEVLSVQSATSAQ